MESDRGCVVSIERTLNQVSVTRMERLRNFIRFVLITQREREGEGEMLKFLDP